VSDTQRSLRVLVTVGTDFHPFQRLIDWADRWAEAHPASRVLVQHGSTPGPLLAEGIPFLSPDALHREMEAADVVVTHGGPATITEARRRRKLPVCVPRDPALGEHVDDHQLRFARFLGERGMVRLVTAEVDFDRALADGTHTPGAGSEQLGGEALPPGVVLLGEIVAQLVREHRGR
jgi:UDP-N-acetylglucosamine transferase subunit ALG13